MLPSIDCLGVHEVPSDQTIWREDIDAYYRSLGLLDETQPYRSRLVPIVLIEAVIHGADSAFDGGKFVQSMEGVPEQAAQVAYDEHLLSMDGRSVVAKGQGCLENLHDGRICFFLHYYDPTRPVRWSYGEFSCPALQPMDERLAKLVPYQGI